MSSVRTNEQISDVLKCDVGIAPPSLMGGTSLLLPLCANARSQITEDVLCGCAPDSDAILLSGVRDMVARVVVAVFIYIVAVQRSVRNLDGLIAAACIPGGSESLTYPSSNELRVLASVHGGRACCALLEALDDRGHDTRRVGHRDGRVSLQATPVLLTPILEPQLDGLCTAQISSVMCQDDEPYLAYIPGSEVGELEVRYNMLSCVIDVRLDVVRLVGPLHLHCQYCW